MNVSILDHLVKELLLIWKTLITWSAELRYDESGCPIFETIIMKHATFAPPSQWFTHYNFLPWGEIVDTKGLLFHYFDFFM